MFRSSRKDACTRSVKDASVDEQSNLDSSHTNELLRTTMRRLFKKKKKCMRSQCDTSLSSQDDELDEYYSEDSCKNSIVSSRDLRASNSITSTRSISKSMIRQTSAFDHNKLQQIEKNKIGIERLTEDFKSIRCEVQAVRNELMSELQLIRYDMMKDIALIKGAISGARKDGYTREVIPVTSFEDPSSRATFSGSSMRTKIGARSEQALHRGDSLDESTPHSRVPLPSEELELDTLFPRIDFSSEIKANASRLHPKTRQWVIHYINQWVSSSFWSSENRLLTVVGDGGTGKTAIASKICLEHKKKLLGCHFCRFDCKMKSTPRIVVLSLVNQLACAIPLYKKLIRRLNVRYLLSDSDPYALLEKLMIQPLRSMPEAPFTGGFILMDGIDQFSADSEKNDLLDLTAHLALRLPKWIGLIITSKPSRTFVMKLPTTCTLDFSARCVEHVHDSGRLIDTVLLNFEPDAEEQIRDVLLKKSGGNILYLQYIQQALSHPTLRSESVFVSRNVLNDLPDSLDDIFMDIFQDKFGQGRQRIWTKVKPILEIVVAAASGPYSLISEKQLQQLFPVCVDEWREIRRAFTDILYMDSSTFRFSNSSLYDWITNEKRADYFYLDPTKGLKALRRLLTGDSHDVYCSGPQTL